MLSLMTVLFRFNFNILSIAIKNIWLTEHTIYYVINIIKNVVNLIITLLWRSRYLNF